MSLINKTFNHLTVTGVKRNSKNKKCYVCKCDCGNPKEILIPNKELLLTGRRKSCGCAKTNVLEKYNHLIDTQINKWHILGIKRINQENFKIIKTRDKIKTQYCESNNINLLRIPYWEQQNIDKIIINRLQRLSEKGSMNNFIEYATV